MKAHPLLFAPWILVSCATPGPPVTSRFLSNRGAEEAYACVTNRLRAEGFELDAPSDSGTAVALLEAVPGPEVTDRWWRVELSVSRSTDGETIVETVASAAPRQEGPYAAAGALLMGVIGKLAASCTW